MKRTAATRDALPDEAFARVRGALFFGPAFRVTRNKLTFRDNLAELLAAASPGASQRCLCQSAQPMTLRTHSHMVQGIMLMVCSEVSFCTILTAKLVR